MTVSDQQMQAVNVINQHAQFLLRELEQADRDKRNLRSETVMLSNRVKEEQKKYTAQEVARLRARNAELETQNRQQRQYMKLKDDSKIKVEQQRDAYKREAEDIRAWREEALRAKRQLEEAQKLNTTQAQAYKALQERYNNLLLPRSDVARAADGIKGSILTTEVNLLTSKLAQEEAVQKILKRERDEALNKVRRLENRLKDIQRTVTQAVGAGERWDEMGR